MKDLLKTAAILFAMFAGTVLLIGFVVPREHTARCEALYDMRPRDLFAKVADVSSWSKWAPGVELSIPVGRRNGHESYQVNGKRGTLLVQVLEANAPTKLVLSIQGDKFHLQQTLTLSTQQHLALLRIEETGTNDDMFDRGLSVFDDPHDPLLAWLSAFAEHHRLNTIPQIVPE